ncbi:MAG: tetratricopeptide repeat protein [Cyclobacteriaceae bacterium]
MQPKILLILIILTACSTRTNISTEDWEQGKAELADLIANGEFEKATELATERIELAETSDINDFQRSNSYSDLGLIYQETGHYSESKSAFEKALEIYPNNAVTHYNLGLLYRDFGELDESIECFSKAINIYSKNLDVYDSSSIVTAGLALALALVNTGELDESNKLIDVATIYFLQRGDSNKYIQSLKIRATHDIVSNKASESLETYRTIKPNYEKNRNPLDLAELLNDIGSAFYFSEQYDSAIFYFAKSIDLKLSTYSDSAMIRVSLKNLASAHEQLGNTTLAADLMNTAERIKADNKR